MGNSEQPTTGESKDILRRLRHIFELVSCVQNPTEEVKCWREKAGDLCYDLEDAIGSSKFSSAHVKDALDLMQSKLLSTWKTNCVEDPGEGKAQIDAPSTIEGIDDLKKEIIKFLHSADQVQVVSIVGPQGSGKTTLAKQVYKDYDVKCDDKVKCDYKVRIEMRKHNVKDILINLLQQFGGDCSNLHFLQELTLVHRIQEKIQGKRFLVLADDVCDETAWIVIRDVLLYNNSSAKILMTTQRNDIAYLGGKVYRIDHLSNDISKSILQKSAIDSEKYQSYLHDHLEAILEKCGGLPLAIVVMCDVLKETVSRPRELGNFMNSAVEEDYIKRLKMKLSLGYSELPYQLRKCLLYLSIFPARYIIKRKRLVYRWIAQGLVHPMYGENVVEQANSYFNELINRNWIEAVNTKYDGQARACRVHNAVLDFIVDKSAEENFVALFLGCEENKVEKKKIENLSIQYMQDNPIRGEMSCVRSLTIFGCIKKLPSPLISDSLRVLDLEDCNPDANCSHDGNKPIVDASVLVYLRYLSLGSLGIIQLGEEGIAKMQHLETLELRKSRGLREAQLDITGLQQMVRLFVDSDTTLKDEISMMKELEEVKYISVHKHPEDLLKGLGELTKLRILGIFWNVLETSNNGKKKALVSSLCKLGNCKLESLCINGIGVIFMELHSNGDSGKTALPSIRKFKMSCYIGDIPTWLGSLMNLQILRLRVFTMKPDQLAVLGGLPCLLDLFLDIFEVEGENIIFRKQTGFRFLDRLGIYFFTEAKVEFKSGCLPCLQHLMLHPDLAYGVTSEDCIVLGIEHLSPGTRIDVVIHRTCNTGDALSSKGKHTREAEVVNKVKDHIKKKAGNRVTEFTEKTQTLTDRQISDVREKLWRLTEDQANKLTVANIDINCLQYLLKYMRSSLRMESDDRNPNSEWRTMVKDFCNDVDQAIRDLSLPDSSPPPDNFPLEELKSGFDENMLLLPKRTTENLQVDPHITKKQPGTHDKPSSSQSSDQSEDAEAYSVPIDSRVQDLQRDTENLVGTDAQIQTIIKCFEDQQQQSNCKVVSIVGFGGIGKTALAKRVFHRIKENFDCSAIVTVSQNMSMDNLIRDILLHFNTKGKPLEGKDPMDQLKNFVSDKRYFVVLDDIWKEEHWKEIKSLFSTNSIGSAMITTTRIRSIAKMCVQNDGYLHDMKPLSMSDSKKLFLRRIFGSEKYPSYPEQSCNGVVQKCGGSPLAIITVSSLLANNASTDHWEEVHKKLMACEFSKETGAEDMSRRLSLSFDDLPYPIGMCLLYLSIFPEDYEFNRKDLINRWIAEGLIGASKKTKSVVAEYYFYELINRSLIEPVKIRYDGKVKACRVHDTILDFLVSKSTEINFTTLLGARVIVSNKIRRLSMQNIQEADVKKLEGRDLSQIHSVTMFGPAQIIPSDKEFPLMRVLSLENIYDPTNHSSQGYPITNDRVRKLSRLEYLNHGASCTMGFLSEVGHLQFLRTLDLKKTSITELPPSILKLRHLVRLLVCIGTKLPDQIGEMVALEELKYVDITRQSETFLSELAKLTKLRLLVIGFELDKMLDEEEKMLVSSLSTLGHYNLQSLSAAWTGELMNFWSLWEQAAKNLHKFSIWSSGYIESVPYWMDDLPNLQKLRLRVKNLDKNGLQTLGNLQGLVDLFLDIIDIPEETLVYGEISHWFPKLEYFGIQTSISGMTYLTFEKDLMKQVKYVKLDLTADSRAAYATKGLDFGIQYLRSLTMLHVNIQSDRGDKIILENIKTAINNASKLNKCTVKFESSWVDDETEEDEEDEEVESQQEE